MADVPRRGYETVFPFWLLDLSLRGSVCVILVKGYCVSPSSARAPWCTALKLSAMALYGIFFNKMAQADCCWWRQRCTTVDGEMRFQSAILIAWNANMACVSGIEMIHEDSCWMALRKRGPADSDGVWSCQPVVWWGSGSGPSWWWYVTGISNLVISFVCNMS